MTFSLRTSAMALTIIGVVAIGHYGYVEAADGRPSTTSTSSGTAELASRITVRNASPAQITRLGEALEKFSDAGLGLPAVEIRFFADDGSCGAEHGRFYTTEGSWHISICDTEVDSVYEHELAHAWERANVTDDQRRAFMQMRGYTSWSDHDLPWRERGIEGAAFVIEKGVSGLPLPPVLGSEASSRLQAYELLTGQPALTMIEWLADSDVPCDERPTPMSSLLPDESGLTCHRQLAP